jgi:hypothetical protein
MATYQATLKNQRLRANTTQDGLPTTFTSTFVMPIGFQVTSGDIIQWVDISALHTVEQVRVFTSDLDDGTTLTSNWGIQQIAPGVNTYGGLTAAGVAQDFDVATSTFYVSPATNATYFQSANAVVGRAQGWNSLVLANTTDIDGPVVRSASSQHGPTRRHKPLLRQRHVPCALKS